MPLPKPPASKATLLSATDYETQAAARIAKRSLQPSADPSKELALKPAEAPVSAPRQETPPAPRTPAAPVVVAKPRTVPTGPARLFVLDTNVLMHDPLCLFRFEEHDIFLPMITLEELDSHKRGMSEVARNARQASRELDALASGGRTEPQGRHPAGQDRQARGAGPAVLPDHAARGQAARGPAAGQGRQPDPRRRQVAAGATPQPRHRAGVERHQHARQGTRTGPAGRGLPERQDARRRRPALHRPAAAAGRLLGAPWQDHGKLEPGRPHLLSHRRPAGAGADDQPVRLSRVARRRAAVCPRDRDHRQDRGAEDPARTTRTRRTPSGA